MTQMMIQKNKLIGITKKSFTSLLIKDIVKDTDEQPDEEVHRMKYGRVPGAGASVPKELGWPYLPGMWMLSPNQKLLLCPFFNRVVFCCCCQVIGVLNIF